MPKTIATKTNPLFPGLSIIELVEPFGAMRGSLIRHWPATAEKLAYCDDHGNVRTYERSMVWYEFVLRGMGSTYTWPVDRITAARLLFADRMASRRARRAS